MIRESYKLAMSLQEKLAMFYGKALQVTHKGWEQLMENLATWDFTLLHDQWLHSAQIRYTDCLYNYTAVCVFIVLIANSLYYIGKLSAMG